MTNELKQFSDVLKAAHEASNKKWKPKLEFLAEQINSGKLHMPKDTVLRKSLQNMKANRKGPIMSTIDSNVRMFANMVWDAEHHNKPTKKKKPHSSKE